MDWTQKWYVKQCKVRLYIWIFHLRIALRDAVVSSGDWPSEDHCQQQDSLLRTILTQMIRIFGQMLPIGSNHLLSSTLVLRSTVFGNSNWYFDSKFWSQWKRFLAVTDNCPSSNSVHTWLPDISDGVTLYRSNWHYCWYCLLFINSYCTC